MKDKIQEETIKCLKCKLKPCSKKGCPLHNNIPEFIEALKNENYLESYKILSETTVLSGICGKICPHDKQCQGSCVRGIKVEYEKELGRNLKLEELEKEYDAIFLSIGANKSTKMGVEGETLNGVYGGNELLEYNLHPNYKNKNIAIIGGGNVAIDCARTIKKLGAKKVTIIYRRAEEQMPAERKEIEEAKKEGIEFAFKNNIVKIIGEKSVEKIELIKTELIKKEGEERLSPVNIENSNYTTEMDYVIMALGSKPSEIVDELGLELNKWGNIKIDEQYRTSKEKIYAGGDLAGIKGTVAWAAYSGREAAKSIIDEII